MSSSNVHKSIIVLQSVQTESNSLV